MLSIFQQLETTALNEFSGQLYVFEMFYFQARQQIAQEYEYVKDINRTLADFKRDNFNAAPPPAKLRDYGEIPTRETRDPDVWLPPAPVERDPRLKFWLWICIRIIVCNFSVLFLLCFLHFTYKTNC